MSPALNLAITLPEQPLVLAAPAVALLVVVLAVVVFRKRRSSRRSPWETAAEELGIDHVKDGSDHGPVARGKVNDHVVYIAPTAGKKRGRKKMSTLYNVKYEATEAPKFILMKRVDERTPILDTGNPKFDAVVSVRAEQPELFADFLTPARRAAILRLLTYWPVAQITNRETHLKTTGLEDDHDRLVDTVCHLVATAEAFDRPTPKTSMPTVEASVPSAEPDGAAPLSSDHSSGADAATETETGSLLTEVRLDEASVLADLFASDLDEAGISARFSQRYQGRDVSWTGEVLRVGSLDGGMQRIAAFIGSADGQDPESGRVVALTAVIPDASLAEGAVVGFTGRLVNLDARQRLFHVAV